MCEAESGLIHITGHRDAEPVKVGVAITDLTTGLYAKGAILAALISRGKTGKGVHIGASLMESQIASLANIASNYLISGQEATRHGTAHPSIVPYQVFPCGEADFVMIAGGNDKQFERVAACLGKPEWSTDERFSSNATRVANRDTLIKLMTEVLKSASARQAGLADICSQAARSLARGLPGQGLPVRTHQQHAENLRAPTSDRPGRGRRSRSSARRQDQATRARRVLVRRSSLVRLLNPAVTAPRCPWSERRPCSARIRWRSSASSTTRTIKSARFALVLSSRASLCKCTASPIFR